MIPWHVTANLILDRDGILWYAARLARATDGTRPFLPLGPVEEVIGAGILAGDLESEARECLDLWGDRCDDRMEQMMAYQSTRGMRRWSA